MPYRPEQLILKQNERAQAEIDALIERIDADMLKNYRDGPFRHGVGPIDPAVFRGLSDAYRKAGWIMEKESDPDPRDTGCVLVFTPIRDIVLHRPA